jgi:hypothetical protein
MGSIEADLE